MVVYPTVVGTDPEDHATGVPPGNSIRIEFSLPMDEGSLVAAFSISASETDWTPVLIHEWISSTVLQITTDIPFPVDTDIVAIISKKAMSQSGEYLQNVYLFGFTSSYAVTPIVPKIDVYATKIYRREPTENYFTLVTAYKTKECTVEERIDDAKNISLILSAARNSHENIFPIDFMQGDDIVVIGYHGNARLFVARGIVTDNIDSERDVHGSDYIRLELRGVLATLGNSFSTSTVGTSKALGSMAGMLIDYDISGSEVSAHSVEVCGTINDTIKPKESEQNSEILSRLKDIVDGASTSLHFYERDDIIDDATSTFTVKTRVKVLILSAPDGSSNYILSDSDYYAGSRKTPRAKCSASLYKYGTRFVLKVYDNLMRRYGRRDNKEEDRETAKLQIIKDMVQDEEIQLISNKPFPYRMGEYIGCDLKSLQFHKYSYLVARSYNITPNSFECKLTFNVIPKPLIDEMKLALGLK